MILDLDSGFAFARSASQTPLVLKGIYGDSIWIVRDSVPGADSAERLAVATHLNESQFHFSLPFTLLDTTLGFTLEGEEPSVDTAIQKGREPGTYDTTLADYTLKKLRVEFAPGQAPYPWLLFFLDGRDGRIRRVLEPAVTDSGAETLMITYWSDIQDILGLKVGGRRVSYPADRTGSVTGPYVVDRRYYGIEFPRRLEEMPFTWTPPPVVDTAAAPES
jgi:hypothetical protein